MSVKVRKYKRGGFEVDISFKYPDGTPLRKRLKSKFQNKTRSREWGIELERILYEQGPKKNEKQIPTLREFSKTFMEDHVKANQHKPSGISAKETIFRVHLIPFFGDKKLNEIGNKDIQDFKKKLTGKAHKTVNNILTVLNTVLNIAADWEVIEQVPCRIRLLKVSNDKADFFSFEEFEKLLSSSKNLGPNEHLTILLGGDAGLRCGEIMALKWADIDFPNRLINVQRSIWKGHETATKGEKTRVLPMTTRLAKALRDHRHLISDRVLVRDDGSDVSQKMVRSYVLNSCKRAQIKPRGPHTLRHTFCSHLAIKGAPMVAIKDAAGHTDVRTTMRYTHLSPNTVTEAIKLLEQPNSEVKNASGFGDI